MSDKTLENSPHTLNLSAEGTVQSCLQSTDLSVSSCSGSTPSNFTSLVTLPIGVETLFMPIQMLNSNDDFNERKNLKSYPKQLLMKGKHSKFRLIRKSPMKGSPTKCLNHILRKRKKVKSKGLSPRKLKFILPKVTKFSPRKLRQPRLLKSKPIAPLPSELCNIVTNGEHGKSSLDLNRPHELSNKYDVKAEILDFHESVKEEEKDLNICGSSENLVESKGDVFPSEGGEEEDLEDANHEQQQQDYLAAFLKASSTIAFQKSTDRKGTSNNCEQKLTKQQRRVNDRVFALSYVPDINSHQDVLILSYLTEVKETLSSNSNSKFEEFVEVLKGICSPSHVIPAYYKIIKILEGFPDLQDAFVMFLKPEEAIAVGKYSEYLMINCLRSFAEELKEHSKRQPQNLQKVIRTLDTLLSQSNSLDVDHIMNALTPVLKLQPWLLDLPDDFEEVNLDSPSSPDAYEHIILPDDDVKGPSYKCLCCCHSAKDSGQLITIAHNFKSEHCLSCALRFIDGRIYLQCGRALRLAKVFYDVKDDGQEPPITLNSKGKLENSLKRDIKQQTFAPTKVPKVSQKSSENSPETEKAISKKNRKTKKS
ncbi:hypothetical protein Anas_08630 [Armadillidium nasatum]|uniref:GON-4-like protein n=1 Tax=Armadillidium nasatum TaxID=96803 RepID=A0A5N5SKD4_9CRUS|nr:hypothetical protein Anas_08630 [Armadillidium nasatum]